MLRYRIPATSSAAPGAERQGSPGGGYAELARVLASQLSQTPDPLAAAREAGRRWTQALETGASTPATDPVAAVLELMTRLGFAPDRPAEGGIHLHRCPFEAVAREHRQVVCGVHLGMLEETLARLGGTVRLTGMVPFASDDPLLCTVEFEPTGRP